MKAITIKNLLSFFIKQPPELHFNLINSGKTDILNQQQIAGQLSPQKIDEMHINMKQSIEGFTKIFIRIQAFYWLYFFYVFTSACETFALILWDFVIGLFNLRFSIITIGTIKRTPFYATLIILAYILIIQDYQILDVSSLYHFFRGQTTVKLYSAGLSIEIFQKILTVAGKTYLNKLPKVIIYGTKKIFQLKLELFLSFLYVIAHFFIIYVDFILFAIIINCSFNSRLVYLFIVNLGKLKAAAFKKFQKNSYKLGLIYDAKDRFYKISYSIIFLLSMEQRIEVQLITSILEALIFSTIIDYLRHLVLLSMGGQLNRVKYLRETMFKELFLKQSLNLHHSSIMKCVDWDFTVIPYIIFVLKFLVIIIEQIKRIELRSIITQIYFVLVLYVILAKFIFWLIKLWHIQQNNKQQRIIIRPI